MQQLSPNRPSIYDDLSGLNTNQQLAGRFSAIQPTLIERQRELEQKEENLRREFAEIDLNNDGRVGMDELMAFLDKRSEGEFDRQIVDQLFKRLDQDMDGKITIEEFIGTYLDAEQNLRQKITDSIKIMSDHTRQRDEIKNKIREAKIEERTTQYGIMEGSILTVNLVEARDLFHNTKVSTPFVVLQIEGQQVESRVINANNAPVWNQSISFDIYNGQDPLKVRVMNREAFSDELVGQFALDLVSLKDQMKHEDWFPIYKNNAQNGKVRLVTQWIHSKVLFLTDVLGRWEETLAVDTDQKARLEALLLELRKPFGFLTGDASREVSKIEHTASVNAPKLNISMPNTGIMMQEVEKAMFDSKISKSLDNYLGRFGIKDSLWWKVCFYALIIYMLLTCLVMFYRTDFINLSYSVGAFYTIVYGEYKKKSVYTALIYSSFGIIIFDIVWLILFHGDWNGDIPLDGGGIEKGIRRFSLVLSYLNFLFRIVVIIALWKVSLNLEKYQSQANGNVQVVQGAPGYLRKPKQEARMDNIIQNQKPSSKNPFESELCSEGSVSAISFLNNIQMADFDFFPYDLPELEGKPVKVERCVLFKKSENIPRCFTENTPKEELVLEHVLEYERQFAIIHDPNRILFMTPQNECGVLKFICTTLRPSKLPFIELYDYESCAKFICRFIDYEQLNPPTEFPRIIPSPSNVLRWQRGDSFDMSILLTSLLIGYGYDAYCIYGRAPKYITTKDETLLQCPYPLSYDFSDLKQELPDEWGAKKEKPSDNEQKLEKDFKFPPKPPLVSNYIQKKDKEDEEEQKRVYIAEHTIDDDQPDMEAYDKLLNRRMHCWVLLKKGKRELNETFFLEPTTGRRYDIEDCPYLSVDCIFNEKNYWVNLHPNQDIDKLDWDFQLRSQNPDEMNWEYVMLVQDEGEEDALNEITSQQGEKQKSEMNNSDEQGEESEEEVLDMPPPWPPKLTMDREAYHKISRLGEETAFYEKCKVDVYAEYSQPDGLTLKMTIYQDFQRHIIKEIRSHFMHRRDRLLIRRRFPFEFRTVEEYAPNKETNFWQRMEFINGTSRKLWFYPFRNEDGLIYREEQIGDKTIEKYKGRDDRLIYRSCKFHVKKDMEKKQGQLLFEDNHCKTCVIDKMVQKYEVNTSEGAPPSQHQIAKTEMNMQKDIINIFYHYEEGKITATEKIYSRKELLGGSAQAADAGAEGDNGEENADQQEKQAIMQREIECHVQIKTNEGKAKTEMENRLTKEKAIQECRDNMEKIYQHVIEKSVYEKAREKSKYAHRQAKEEAEDKKEQHFLMPILKKLGYENLTRLDMAQAINVKNEALRRLKERLLARADIIQKRIEQESEQLKQFYNNHIRNRDPSAADDKNFDDTVNRMNFKIEILTERASQHYRHALRKFEELDHKLMQEELLSALHKKP